MNKSDKKKFSELMWLFANDACIQISKEQLSVKFIALNKYSIEQISKASNRLIHHRILNYPAIPSIPEFVKAIEEDTKPIDSKTTGQLQLDIVMKYFTYYGSTCAHEFKNSITKYLMTNRWSFQQLGQMEPDELKWFKINFVKDYEDIDNQKDQLIEYTGEQGTIRASKLKQLIGGDK